MTHVEAPQTNYQKVRSYLEGHGWQEGMSPNVPNRIIAVDTGLTLQKIGTSIGYMTKRNLFGELTLEDKRRRIKEGANLALDFGYPDFQEYADWRMVGEEISVALLQEKGINTLPVHINNSLVKARRRGDLIPETPQERSHVVSTINHAKEGKIAERVPEWIETASLIQWQNLDITPLRRADWFLLMRFKNAEIVESGGERLRPFAQAIRDNLPNLAEIMAQRRLRIDRELGEKAALKARMEEINRKDEQDRQSLARKLEIKDKQLKTIRAKQEAIVAPIKAVLVSLRLDGLVQNFYQYTIIEKFRQAHLAVVEDAEAMNRFDEEMKGLPKEIVSRLQPCFGAVLSPKLAEVLIKGSAVGIPQCGLDWETLAKFWQAKVEQLQGHPGKYQALVAKIDDLPEHLTPCFRAVTEYLANHKTS